MSTNSRDLLVRGTAAAKAQQKEEARFYLEWLLRTNAPQPERLEAYYWLSEISPDPAEKRQWIEELLAKNPGDGRARRSLALLEGRLEQGDVVDPNNLPTTAPASPQPVAALRFTCPQCGARMVYSPDGSSLQCEFCHERRSVGATDSTGGPLAQEGALSHEQDFVAALATAKGHARPEATLAFDCQGCGVTFTLPAATLSVTCPYCMSVYVVKAAETRQLIPPQAIIPMKLTAAQAQIAVGGWFKLRRLADARLIAINGLYLPVWTFALFGEIRARYLRQNGDDWVVETRLKPVLSETLISASKQLPAELAEELNHFQLGGLLPYDPGYLASWPAESYALALAGASLLARRQALADIRSDLQKTILDRFKDLTVTPTSLWVDSYKLLLLPLWLAHYSSQGKQYDVVVNGQTGAVRGETPARGLKKWLGQLLAEI